MGLVFLIVAIVLFVLAGLGVAVPHVAAIPWGLAFLAAAFAVGTGWPWPRRPAP